MWIGDAFGLSSKVMDVVSVFMHPSFTYFLFSEHHDKARTMRRLFPEKEEAKKGADCGGKAIIGVQSEKGERKELLHSPAPPNG